MFTKTNLHLLLEELEKLSRTPYFNKSLEEYLSSLIQAIELVIDDYEKLPSAVTHEISNTIWTAAKYLKGGSSKTIPYESVYALKIALKDWVSGECAITTALLDDLNYHFNQVAPGDVIEKFIPSVSFETKLIQIALPKLYRHRPIYNVALYHELGHFVDRQFGITKLTMLAHPLKPEASEEDHRIYESHLGEYFADLFAASYTGTSIASFLNLIVPNQAASFTHPATNDRTSVVNDFLSKKSQLVVDMFQSTLANRGLPSLEIRYVAPDIKESFNNIRTYQIANTAELHGIIESGWTMWLEEREKEPWVNLEDREFARILNDLIEKSIRNKMISTKWNDANS